MKEQIKVWTGRVLVLALICFAVYKWGVPLYKQYFTKKTEATYVPTTTVKSGQFTVSFHEIGTLDARNSVPVISPINGKLITLVEEGIIVKAGDLIAELDTTDLEREVRTQRLNYENTLADVNRVQAEFDLLKEQNKNEVEEAQAQLDFDKAELEKAKERRDKKIELAKEKLVAGSEVDQADLEVRSKELAVKTGEMALALKMKEVQSKESQKEADVRNKMFVSNMAKFNLEDAERHVKDATIKAPTNGMVVLSMIWDGSGRRAIKEGDNVNRQQTICQLPDLNSMLAHVDVGESDAPKVLIGMQTLIRLEAVPKRIFHGVVEDIASLATESDPFSGTGGAPGRKNFTITIAIKEKDPKVLKPGMTADVEFLEKVIDSAVYVPIEAVIEKNGKTYAFIKQGDNYIKTPVQVGTRNDNFICIIKGLRKGDVVALRDPSLVIQQETSGKSKSAKAKTEAKSAPVPEAGGK